MLRKRTRLGIWSVPIVITVLVLAALACGSETSSTRETTTEDSATPAKLDKGTTATAMPTEGSLWCPDCAAENISINLWENGDTDRGRIVAKANHGDDVEVLDRNYEKSESRYYYKVKVEETGAQGWVPETLIQFERLNEDVTTIDDGVVYHTVQAGETLAIIAEKYVTSVERIVELNNIEDPDALELGQKLIISVPADWPLVPGATKQPTALQTPTEASIAVYRGTATTGVNLRSGPGTQFDRIGGLSENDPVEIRSKTSNGEWYEVQLPSGSTAWVASAYIATEADVSGIPTAAPTTTSAGTPTNVPARPTPTAAQPKKGWLCDYDGTGSVRLWTAAAMDATVKDIVGTCTKCCVDVVVYGEDLANGILFYWIDVGSQSGWVDVDYLYWKKPGWATN